jgi:hypothetical protein
MTQLVITAIGVWIAFSGFILLVICMNSSRLSQMQGPVRRYPSRIGIPERQGFSEVPSGSSPINVE